MKTLSKSLLWYICAVFGTRQHVDYGRMFWNKTSYALKFRRFSEWLISIVLKLQRSIFVQNVVNFMEILEME